MTPRRSRASSSWEPLGREEWWTDPAQVFSGARMEATTVISEPHYRSVLLDGRRHGRQTVIATRHRRDQMFWFGVQHGVEVTYSRRQPPRDTARVTFRVGLRDGHAATLSPEGQVKVEGRNEQGHYVREPVQETPEQRQARAQRERFLARFGTEFQAGERFSLGPPEAVTQASALREAEAAAVIASVKPALEAQGLALDVALAIGLTDEGRLQRRALVPKVGGPCVALTWWLGDTLVGVILEEGRVVARVSDGGLVST